MDKLGGDLMSYAVLGLISFVVTFIFLAFFEILGEEVLYMTSGGFNYLLRLISNILLGMFVVFIILLISYGLYQFGYFIFGG
ncbi:MAG: hypothetical protein ACOC2W_03100 [bacterium]